MPSTAAHALFAQVSKNASSQKVRDIIGTHENMFKLGAQGPDLLFFHEPYRKNAVYNLGITLHDKVGSYYFNRLKDTPKSTAQLAYLLGVCCHYALDSNSHAYINTFNGAHGEHSRLEAQFDGFMMAKMNCKQKRYELVPKINVDIDALALSYPEISRRIIKNCVHAMRFYMWLADTGKLLYFITRFIKNGDTFAAVSLPGKTRDDDVMRNILSYYESAISNAAHFMQLVADDNTEAIEQQMKRNFEGITL